MYVHCGSMNILNMWDLFLITVRPVYEQTRGDLKMRLLSAFAVYIQVNIICIIHYWEK
jgi:hypothetical protein